MKVFGRNDLREVICERDTKPSVAQVMHLVSGDTIQQQITAKEAISTHGSHDASLTDRQIVENIYLAALTRKPGEDEVSAASGSAQPVTIVSPAARRRAFEDLLWTAFNSKEFLFHH